MVRFETAKHALQHAKLERKPPSARSLQTFRYSSWQSEQCMETVTTYSGYEGQQKHRAGR